MHRSRRCGGLQLNPVALDTVQAIDGRPGTLALLLRDVRAHAARFGHGDSYDEALTFSMRMRSMVVRSAPPSPAPMLPRLRQPRRCPQGGRPRARRTRSSRAGPSDDDGGEPGPPLGGAW